MTDSAIQLVVFDLGGVLIRLCDGWEHACELAGVTPRKPLSEADKAELVKLVHIEEVGGLAHREFYGLASAHLGLTADETLAMSDAWLRGAYPGIEGLIDALLAAGLTTACLSNTNENHWLAMTDPGHPNGLPLDKLHHRFASHLVKDRKPNPTIYRHVQDVTGVPAEGILFFDDSAENIEAAGRAGWRACHVTDQKDPVGQMTLHLKSHKLI